MSTDPSPPSAADWIKQSTEALTSLLRWIAELFLKRNWFTLLVLLGLVLLFLGTPGNGWVVKLLGLKPPSWYSWVFLAALAVVFGSALVFAICTLPPSLPAQPVNIEARRAIKGLRPFEPEDAAIFAKLQRGKSLQECRERLASPEVRLEILVGESGCGKTSFLQAGVLPHLADADIGAVGIYVRLSDQDPLDTLREGVMKQVGLPMEASRQADLLVLLKQVSEKAGKPLVLPLDQFEQFFVQCRTKADREPFKQVLAAWYAAEEVPVKVVIGIRADFYVQLVEVQEALNCSLGSREVFRLEKFTPDEATAVLEEIAKSEQLSFDRRFVLDLTKRELVKTDDGLISPVDLQVFTWMLERQATTELRVFNRQAFQKFGGVEGLLSRFLDESLKTLPTKAQYETALKVLLALTDLDRQTRAGTLLLPAIQEKLRGSVGAEAVSEAVTWLARGDVRLISLLDKDGEAAYELAHEQLIPALMRLAGKKLSAVEWANRLLDQRVNEWEGNQFSNHYLLRWHELLLIQRQRPYLVWGSKQEKKERLLLSSWRQLYGIVALLGVPLLALGIWFSWLNLTPEGTIQRVKWVLEKPFATQSSEEQVKASVALAEVGDWSQAVRLVNSKISNPYSKSIALSSIAEAAGKLGDKTQAAELLKDLNGAATKIDDPDFKSSALSSIAEAAGKLGDKTQTAELLKDLNGAATKIDDPDSKSSALSSIAEAEGKLHEWQLALQILDNCQESHKFKASAQILKAWAEDKHHELIPLTDARE